MTKETINFKAHAIDVQLPIEGVVDRLAQELDETLNDEQLKQMIYALHQVRMKR